MMFGLLVLRCSAGDLGVSAVGDVELVGAYDTERCGGLGMGGL